MTVTSRQHLDVEVRFSSEPEIGRWLWALEDTRRRTLELLVEMPEDCLDWQSPGDSSTIGTILYHIALIEADWLYAEVLEQPYPPEVVALFPDDVRNEQGQLTPIGATSLERHIERLQIIRARLLEAFQNMEPDDFRRARALPAYDVTPAWVLHHLIQHEAEHRGQIGTLRAAAELARTGRQGANGQLSG